MLNVYGTNIFSLTPTLTPPPSPPTLTPTAYPKCNVYIHENADIFGQLLLLLGIVHVSDLKKKLNYTTGVI